MKVFTSLLVFALVAVAASAINSPVNEAKLKEGIAKVDKSIADFQKRIADAKVKLAATNNPSEQRILSRYINIIGKQVEKLKEIKEQLQAMLPKA